MWDMKVGPHPWLTEPREEDPPFAKISDLAVDYLLPDYRLDAAGFDLAGFVHVEAAWDPSDPVGETRWLASYLAGVETPYAIVAGGDLLKESFPELLAAHRKASDRVVGIRQLLNYHLDPTYTFTNDPNIMHNKIWRNNFAHLGDQKMIFDLQIFPDQAAGAAGLAQEFPQTAMVINHFIMPLNWDSAAIAEWKIELAKLAAHKNIAVKLSGLYMYHRNWPQKDMNILIDTALELFSPERVMWGSNFPVDRQYVSLEKLTADFESSLARHDLATRDAVMWKTANNWYHLGAE